MMTGHGDIALTKDTAYRLYCDENDDGVADGDDWCMDLEDLVMLPSFGQAPSHPALYNPDYMDSETVELVQNALVSLNDDSEGTEILKDLLNTDGMVATNADNHLGTYGAAVANVPGIQAYFS
jgi:ABC-type phosphate/phosphonate transport system substrate-binding protein